MKIATQTKLEIITPLIKQGLYPSQIHRQYPEIGKEFIAYHARKIRGHLKQGRPKGLLNVPGEVMQERVAKAKSLREKGYTLEKIGQHFGLTRERARQYLLM